VTRVGSQRHRKKLKLLFVIKFSDVFLCAQFDASKVSR